MEKNRRLKENNFYEEKEFHLKRGVCMKSGPGAAQWTPSVHTFGMSRPVITFVFKVLRNGLLRFILCTCPNLG